jgi:hypothetical protein
VSAVAQAEERLATLVAERDRDVAAEVAEAERALEAARQADTQRQRDAERAVRDHAIVVEAYVASQAAVSAGLAAFLEAAQETRSLYQNVLDAERAVTALGEEPSVPRPRELALADDRHKHRAIETRKILGGRL